MASRSSSTTSLSAAARLGDERFRRHQQDRARRTTSHWFTWRHLRCKVDAVPDVIDAATTHLELTVIAARDVPCPITETGFLAHQIDTEELAVTGGAVAFFTDWMNREARSKHYQHAEFLWRQGDWLLSAELDDESPAR